MCIGYIIIHNYSSFTLSGRFPFSMRLAHALYNIGSVQSGSFSSRCTSSGRLLTSFEVHCNHPCIIAVKTLNV